MVNAMKAVFKHVLGLLKPKSQAKLPVEKGSTSVLRSHDSSAGLQLEQPSATTTGAISNEHPPHYDECDAGSTTVATQPQDQDYGLTSLEWLVSGPAEHSTEPEDPAENATPREESGKDLGREGVEEADDAFEEESYRRSTQMRNYTASSEDSAALKPNTNGQRKAKTRNILPYDNLPHHVAVDYNGEGITTSASLSRLRELDAIYPEKDDNILSPKRDERYLFTLCRKDAAKKGGRYELHLLRRSDKQGRQKSIERLAVKASTFRNFERLARGSGHVIVQSGKDFKKYKSMRKWRYDQKTHEVIHPCFETMRDAAECMVEILQAAIEGYDKGNPMALLVLLRERSVLSSKDPGYVHSLRLLDLWTKNKYKDQPYSCRFNPVMFL